MAPSYVAELPSAVERGAGIGPMDSLARRTGSECRATIGHRAGDGVLHHVVRAFRRQRGPLQKNPRKRIDIFFRRIHPVDRRPCIAAKRLRRQIGVGRRARASSAGKCHHRCVRITPSRRKNGHRRHLPAAHLRPHLWRRLRVPGDDRRGSARVARTPVGHDNGLERARGVERWKIRRRIAQRRVGRGERSARLVSSASDRIVIGRVGFKRPAVHLSIGRALRLPRANDKDMLRSEDAGARSRIQIRAGKQRRVDIVGQRNHGRIPAHPIVASGDRTRRLYAQHGLRRCDAIHAHHQPGGGGRRANHACGYEKEISTHRTTTKKRIAELTKNVYRRDAHSPLASLRPRPVSLPADGADTSPPPDPARSPGTRLRSAAARIIRIHPPLARPPSTAAGYNGWRGRRCRRPP